MTDVNSPEKLKQAQVFTDVNDEESAIDSSLIAIKPSKSFDELEFVCDESLKEASKMIPDSLSSGRRKSWSWLAKLSVFALFLLVMVQTLLGLQAAFEQSPILFGFYTAVLGILTLWVGAISVKEWRKLKQLSKVEQHRSTSLRLSQSMQMGEADKFINQLLRQYPTNEATSEYLAITSDEHNDAEKVMLFDKTVLADRDITAKKVVTRYAAESAFLLAASPLAVLDMAIILWRNQRMVSEIAKIYSIDLGYWSRIKLIRSIVINIIYAGSTEVIADLGTQLLSVELTGKLSTRVAQGLGGGLLTARLGYQAMSLCRPIQFTAANKPKLAHIHQHLLGELSELTSKVKQKYRQTEPASVLKNDI